MSSISEAFAACREEKRAAFIPFLTAGDPDLETTEMWPTTRGYSDFLVRAAATGKPADMPAVLLPCEWGYLDLADGIAAEGAPQDPRYADWIAQYTSPDYREAVDWLKTDLDRLAANAPDSERERLLGIFLASSRYEVRFWDMCWHGEAP